MTDAWILAIDSSWPDRSTLTAQIWANGEPRREDMARELQQEVERRRMLAKRPTSPSMRGTGNKRQDAMLLDIANELSWYAGRASGSTLPFPESRFAWSDRVLEIRREIEKRRTLYPRWIDSPNNRMTRADAARRLWLAEGVHDFFWRDLRFADPTDETLRDGIRHDRYAIARERERLASIHTRPVGHDFGPPPYPTKAEQPKLAL